MFPPQKHKSRASTQARLRISEIYSKLLYRISSYLAEFYTDKSSIVKMNRFMTLVVGAPRRAKFALARRVWLASRPARTEPV
jgi:hypothetical protein